MVHGAVVHALLNLRMKRSPSSSGSCEDDGKILHGIDLLVYLPGQDSDSAKARIECVYDHAAPRHVAIEIDMWIEDGIVLDVEGDEYAIRGLARFHVAGQSRRELRL